MGGRNLKKKTMALIPITHDIIDSASFFQRTFQITVALALGESFKQFVADESKNESDEHVHWDRIPPLLTFVFTLIPFFQGMNRYFYADYLRSDIHISINYSYQLMFDSAMFLLESAFFFMMSRALRRSRFPSFASYLMSLLLVDTAWSCFASLTFETKFRFVVLNCAVIIVTFAARTYARNNPERYLSSTIAVTVISFIIFCIGYYVSWSWYFPTTGSITSSACVFFDVCDILSRLKSGGVI